MRNAAMVCWLAVLGGGCADVPERPSEVAPDVPPQTDTRVHLVLTDFPLGDAEVTKILVTFTHIDVFAEATRSWITVVDYGAAGRRFDLMKLQHGNTDELGAFDLEPGTYRQIRLHLTSDHVIEVNTRHGLRQFPLRIPSGDHTGIKLVHRFTVRRDGPTVLKLDFDARKSVHFIPWFGYVLKPTIKIIEVHTTTLAAKEIHAAEGGEIELLGKARLRIPPGALAEDTTIEIRRLESSESSARGAGLLPGNIVQLEPSGLTFLVPAQLTLFYDPAEIPSGLSLHDMTILSRNQGKPWREHRSVVSENPRTISTSITHFTSFAPGIEAATICPPGSVLVFGRCTDPPTLSFGCRPSVNASVTVYNIDGVPIRLRELLWESSQELISSSIPRSTGCAAFVGDPVACESQPGCGVYESETNMFDCVQDAGQVTLTRPWCGDTDFTLTVPNGNEGVTAHFRVHTPDPYLYVLDRIDIHDDGDNFDEGEIYWRFQIGDVTFDHPSDIGVSSGRTIHVGESVVRESCARSFHVRGFLADEDGGTVGEDDVIQFDFGVRGFGPGESGTGGGSPDGTFHWDVRACP